MSAIDLDIVRRKLDRILNSLQPIREAQGLNYDDYLRDEDLHAIMERQLELAIGAAMDLNVHLLVCSGFGTPADSFTSFIELAQHTQAIPVKLAYELAPATGLRNRLVHQYDDIDHRQVFDSLYRALDLFPKYIAAIEEHLKRDASPENSR